MTDNTDSSKTATTLIVVSNYSKTSDLKAFADAVKDEKGLCILMRNGTSKTGRRHDIAANLMRIALAGRGIKAATVELRETDDKTAWKAEWMRVVESFDQVIALHGAFTAKDTGDIIADKTVHHAVSFAQGMQRPATVWANGDALVGDEAQAFALGLM